jgi:hypothetical protein
MLFGELAKGMLFGELAKVASDWLLRNDLTGNMPEPRLGYLGKFVVDKVKGRMERIVVRDTIAWCGSPLLVLVAAEATWSRVPSSF